MDNEAMVRKMRSDPRYSDIPLKYIKTASLDGAPEEIVRQRLDGVFMENGELMRYDLWKTRIGMSVTYSGELFLHSKKKQENDKT